MIDLAWPFVALVAIAACVWTVRDGLLRKYRATEVAAVTADVVALKTAVVEIVRGLRVLETELLKDVADRLGRIEMRTSTDNPDFDG